MPDLDVTRNFYTTSSCGVCGKGSIDAVRTITRHSPGDDPTVVAAETLSAMPDQLRGAQKVFASTGGLHGAALFDADGTMLVVREDIGRHNAVDKVIGWAVEHHRIPLTGTVLAGQRAGVVRAHPEGRHGRHPDAGRGVGAVVTGGRPGQPGRAHAGGVPARRIDERLHPTRPRQALTIAATVHGLASGVRMRARSTAGAGDLELAVPPGGPGIGLGKPARTGRRLDGAGYGVAGRPARRRIEHRRHPSIAADPYAAWPAVLLEAAVAVPNPVVSRSISTGGMYLLTTPALEHLLGGPGVDQHRTGCELAAGLPVRCANGIRCPPSDEATRAIRGRHRSDEKPRRSRGGVRPVELRTREPSISAAELLARMPYNGAAVAWSDDHFDSTMTPRRGGRDASRPSSSAGATTASSPRRSWEAPRDSAEPTSCERVIPGWRTLPVDRTPGAGPVAAACSRARGPRHRTEVARIGRRSQCWRASDTR